MVNEQIKDLAKRLADILDEIEDIGGYWVDCSKMVGNNISMREGVFKETFPVFDVRLINGKVKFYKNVYGIQFYATNSKGEE